jgi:hypothetical protein
MNTDLYFQIYNTLVVDNNIDTDEAQCIMSDLEDELQREPTADPYDILKELGL